MNPVVCATVRRYQFLFSRRALICGGLLFCCAAVRSQVVPFFTLAGFPGQQNAAGSGTNALFQVPAGSAVDSSGNIYVADFAANTIEKISGSTVMILAGSPGIAGSTNATGTNALFNGPEGLAVDAGGNVYVADSGNDLIRKISSAGVVTTLAGKAGVAGSTNGTGTSAMFFAPAGVAVDSSTNVYVADYGNHTIRKITPAGVVSTLAGSAGVFGSTNATGSSALFYEPEGVAVDASGNVYVADTANNMIRKVTSAGVVTTFAGSTNSGSTNAAGTNALFNAPQAVSVDTSGNVYVADTGNNMIRKITSAGVVSMLAGGTNFGSADGSGASAQFWGPVSAALNSGSIYVADYFNGTVRVVSPAGVVTTLAGSPSNASGDTQGTGARFGFPHGLAADAATNVYVADTENHTIRKINATGVVSTLAGKPGIAGSADGATANARFSGPQGVATDAAANVYVADTANNTIREISGGTVTTLAGQGGVTGFIDGAGTNALFNNPQGIAVDRSNNVYIADTMNFTIRKLSGSTVTTLAGTAGTYGATDSTNGGALFNCPNGIAVDTSGNIYVADCLNHVIRLVTPTGAVRTIAGTAGIWGDVDGTNGAASFFEPEAVLVDSSNNVYVADAGNHTIREITPSGTNWVVTTIAGTPGASGFADGNNASFFYPAGLTINTEGNLIVADSGNNTIRIGGSLPITLFINDVTATPEIDSAFISWTTPVPATTQVLYGLTSSYGSLSSLDSTLSTEHTVLLTGLTPNTTYSFEVNSQDGETKLAATGAFTTGGPIIIQALQAIYSGVWTIDTSGPDKYSSSYKYAATTVGPDSAEALFQPIITTPGYYDVYIWYSEGADRSANVPVLTSYQGGSVFTNLNQTLPGGQWQLLAAAKYFGAGTNGFVRMGNGTGETNKIVIADAVQFIYSGGQDSPTNGIVPAWWAAYYFGTNVVNGSTLGANGYSLLANYILGTSPLDPSATLNFNIAPIKPGLSATFSPWQGGNVYGLQGTADLAHPVWTNVPNVLVTQGTDGNGVVTVTNTSGRRMFYRLTVQVAP
jgi:sugar lactone lactonase YvrE